MTKRIYENNVLCCRYSYLNNKLHGFYYSWHRNGRMKAIIPWVNGVINGTSKIWDEKGEIISIRKYLNGELHQSWKKKELK